MSVTISPASTAMEMPLSASTSSSIGGSPQVGLDHGRVGLDGGGQALGDLAAEVEYGDTVADPHHQAHIMLDQQHCRPAVTDLANELLEGHLLGRVHPGGRFVEQEEPGLGGQ